MTDVKKCNKICKEKGLNNSNYIPPDDYGIKEAKCECCNKIKTDSGTYFKNCIEVKVK
jgi:hypothetical protein